MKANEAPEKIYVHVKRDKAVNVWNSEWIGVNDIEYTRTDAFIKKAAEWFSEIENGTTITDIDKFIEDFEEYLKK